MASTTVIWGLVLCFALCFALCSAEIYEGDILRKNAGFWFLGRFAFENDPSGAFVGTMDINLTCSQQDLPELQGLEVLLYDDEDNSWPSVYQQSKTCQAWRQAAKNWDDNTQSVQSEYKVFWNLTFASNTSWHSKPYITQAVRPRFWYVVLSSCDSNGTGLVHYHVHFLNIQENAWNNEFGVNEMGLNTLFLVLFIFYTIFITVHYFGVFLFWKNHKYVHPLIRLFAVVVTVQFFFILFKMIHYVTFASNGKGIIGLDYFGDVLEVVAKVCFILMIMLLALGWTITSETLYGTSFVILSVFLFSATWIAILIWRLAVQDPAAVELPLPLRAMQIALLGVWFLFALWFLITIIYNWKKEDNPVKRTLFCRLGVLYGQWLIALPTAVVISYLQDPWVRDKIVVSVAICFSTVAHVVMSFLLWPSRAEEYFQVEKPNVNNPAIQHYEHL